MKLTKEQLLKLLNVSWGLANQYGEVLHFDHRNVTEDSFGLCTTEIFEPYSKYCLTDALLRDDLLALKLFNKFSREAQYEDFDVLMKAGAPELKQLIEE